MLANDTDVDGGPKSIQSITQPGNGSAVDHRRRDRPHLHAERELLQPAARNDARHVHLHPERRLDRDGVGDGDVRGDAPVVDTSAGTTSYTENVPRR